MSTAAVALYRAHRTHTITFSRDWMRHNPDGTVDFLKSKTEADHLYRTWHAPDGEYAVLSTRVVTR